MTTRELLNKLPENIVNTIELFRKDYKNDSISKAETRASIAGYVKGLRDAGVLTERERQILFVYSTV